MATVTVPVPEPNSKSYSCSCGRYRGSQWGVSTHRSKTKCGGHVLIDVEVPESATATAPETAAAHEPARPTDDGDAVVVAGVAASGKVVEPKGAAPTVFRGQTESTAELRTYFDYFRASLKYEGDFGLWQEEMARLAIRELFGMELVVRVRSAEVAEALSA